MVLSREYLESFVCERFKSDQHYREGHIHILAPAPGTEVAWLLATALAKDEERARESFRTRNIAAK